MSTAAAWKGFLPKTGVYWQELFFADPNLVISFWGMGLPTPQETPRLDIRFDRTKKTKWQKDWHRLPDIFPAWLDFRHLPLLSRVLH
jgi:hypothetical protein